MCRRKLSAVIVSSSRSSSRSHADGLDVPDEHLVLRLGRREGAEVVLADEERCGGLAEPSTSTGRFQWSARRASSGERARRSSTR